LIPAYNSEKWIKYAIESALSQTWSRKEILIVDDGSLDNSLAIAKSYESRNLKVIKEKHRGASSARNTLYSYAQGDYIQWLDADDLLAPNKISEQMNVADRNSNDLILYSGQHGVFYWRTEKAQFVPNSLWQDLNPVDWLIISFSENVWSFPAGWIVSRKLSEIAGPWDERLTVNDDGEYFSRLIINSERIKFVEEAKCFYRQSGFDQLHFSKSELAYKSMILSKKLSVQHLFSLEKSKRTHKASMVYLQRLYNYFYPDKKEQMEETQFIANELGGILTEPREMGKLGIAKKLFGWKTATRLQSKYQKFSLVSAVKLDEILYRLRL